MADFDVVARFNQQIALALNIGAHFGGLIDMAVFFIAQTAIALVAFRGNRAQIHIALFGDDLGFTALAGIAHHCAIKLSVVFGLNAEYAAFAAILTYG